MSNVSQRGDYRVGRHARGLPRYAIGESAPLCGRGLSSGPPRQCPRWRGCPLAPGSGQVPGAGPSER